MSQGHVKSQDGLVSFLPTFRSFCLSPSLCSPSLQTPLMNRLPSLTSSQTSAAATDTTVKDDCVEMLLHCTPIGNERERRAGMRCQNAGSSHWKRVSGHGVRNDSHACILTQTQTASSCTCMHSPFSFASSLRPFQLSV